MTNESNTDLAPALKVAISKIELQKAEIDQLRTALRELVRLKNLHDACEDQTYWATHAVSRETLDQLHAWEQDYQVNKPKAWEAARAILGEVP